MNAGELAPRLAERPLLLDGGMGSLLIAMGLAAGQAPERWLVEQPARIADVHAQYANAGSDALTTCTFGATPPKLAAAGLAGRCAEINRRAVDLARGAAGDRALVLGDIGPTGLLLAPLGSASEEQLFEAFHAQAAALAEAGADALLCETMFDLREALAAVRAARATGLAVIASMTFEARKRGYFTVMGDRLDVALEALARAGATAVGMNCSVTSDVMAAMVEAAAGCASAPLLAQPNAGQPRATAEGTVYDAMPARFAADVTRMTHAGARVIGGCCGTDPEFIRAARAALDAVPERSAPCRI